MDKRQSMLENLRKHGFSDREIVAFDRGYERLVRESENPEFGRLQAEQQQRNHAVRFRRRRDKPRAHTHTIHTDRT